MLSAWTEEHNLLLTLPSRGIAHFEPSMVRHARRSLVLPHQRLPSCCVPTATSSALVLRPAAKTPAAVGRFR